MVYAQHSSLTLLSTNCVPLSPPRKSSLSLVRRFSISTLSIELPSSLKASLPLLSFSGIHERTE